MKLGKQVAIIALASSIAATGAFAWGGSGKGNCDNSGWNQDKRQMMMKKGGKGMQRGMKRGGGMMFLRGLDLTADQRHEISILKDEMRLEMKKNMSPTDRKDNVKEVFTADGFNKDAFLKNSKERYDERTSLKANYMEKIYNILTPEQRKQVIDNIDKFQPMAWRK